MKNARLGGKLKRLRRERKLSQIQMAEQLGISGSYLNLLEHNQRPVTVPVLLKLAQHFAVDLQSFTEDDDARLLSDLMEALSDPLFDDHDVKANDLRDLVASSHNLGRAVLTLYQAYRSQRNASTAGNGHRAAGSPGLVESVQTEMPAGMPSEEVSEFIQRQQNYFPELEAAAESLWRDDGLSLDNLYRDLVGVLKRRFAVDVIVQPVAAMGDALRDYTPLTRRLALSEMLSPSSRVFQLAHQLGLLACGATLDGIVANGRFATMDATLLARGALANYFAGAVLMPYERFLEAARATRYDVEILEHRFSASFEQVCHRLTTLRRPGSEGIPFHLVRVDIAGNISKRFSASGIRIARFGAACPRWNVYDAFATPGMIRLQVSRMPDGSAFFCLARTVRPPGRSTLPGALRQRIGQLAIGIGCPLSYGRELVYADGLALDDPQLPVPIGVSCSICERTDCSDRALPSLHHKLEVDENRRGLSAYVRPR